MQFEDIDWQNWEPRERATLLFVIRDGQVLLINKKRGLGAGKINGPGGRIDPGETPLACAVREVQEELHVTPFDIESAGELKFQFVDGQSIHVYVFRALGCVGEPKETAEALPLWTPVEDIPYDRMWADDRHWVPLMLRCTPFEGRFLFDDDRLVSYQLRTTDGACC